MQQPPGILIKDANLSYDNKCIFNDLSAQIPAGEWTCILGPSGVGKSSLLRLIAGLDAAQTTGNICSEKGEPLKDKVAYMPQNDLLMPWLSVLDNVLLSTRLGKNNAVLSQQKAQAKDLLAVVGLADVIQQRPSALSGGMRQRVALVRTLLQHKPVVLMDESFSALDAITRLKLQSLAAELLSDKTVLLVTHDPLEALRLGHRIHVLAGTPAHLGEAIIPSTLPLRSVDDAEVLQLQGQLLKQLSAATEVSNPC